MKRYALKNLAAALRERLALLAKQRLSDTEAEQASFEAFFRAAALRYIKENGLFPEADLDTLTELLPEVFPELSGEAGALVRELCTDELFAEIPSEMWRENVCLIGWLYQYYNSAKKDEVFRRLKKNIKVEGSQLPAATQIFTPDWIVRFLTENTLGKVFAERFPGYDTSGLSYYIPRGAEQREGAPEEITFIDPCMGSGNILVCAFDMFMELYRSLGYSGGDAARSVLSRNIYGLDIDSCAFRLSYFALMMKAAEYHPNILREDIRPNLRYFREFTDDELSRLPDECRAFTEQLRGGELFGSLLRPEAPPPESCKDFPPAAEAAELYELLTRKYDAVVTNPPYMSSSNMNGRLLGFIKREYYDFRADLFSAFIVRCTEMAKPGGYTGFLTPYVWMFIHSYEKLRRLIFGEKTLETLVQLEYSAFDEATVPVCAFTVRNCMTGGKGVYIRLTDFRGGLEVQRERTLQAIADRSCGYVFETAADRFSEIPGAPAAYWVSERVLGLYGKYPSLGSIAAPRKGNSTSDNDRFLRLWHEVDINTVNDGCRKIVREETLKKRWFPYNKGGGYRKWYGFNDYVIDWYDDAAEIRSIPTAVIANYKYFMKPGLTWSTLTSGKFSIRHFGEGHIFDNGGCCIFELGEKRGYICALLNSKVFAYIFGQLNPTLNFQSGEVSKFPVIYEPSDEVDKLAAECIELSKAEYDSFETSRGFGRHPLI